MLEGGSRRLEVKIPAGVDNGSKIRISGKGAQGEGGGPAGDLFLIIKVLPHERFERLHREAGLVELPGAWSAPAGSELSGAPAAG